MPRQPIHSDRAPAAIGPYSQAMRAGDTVFLSGQIALDPATGLLVEGDIEAQARRAFDNLKAVCEAAGGRSTMSCASGCTSPTSAQFAVVNAGDGGIFRRAVSRAFDHRGVRACRAARSSKSTPSSSCADASDAPRGARRSTDPRIRRRRRCAAVVARWRGPARRREARHARAAHAAGPVAAPAAALRRPHLAHADPRVAAGATGAGRRRRRSGRARLPFPAVRCAWPSATTRKPRWCCASSISARSRPRSSRRARACAATARRAQARRAWRSCIRVTAWSAMPAMRSVNCSIRCIRRSKASAPARCAS